MYRLTEACGDGGREGRDLGVEVTHNPVGLDAIHGGAGSARAGGGDERQVNAPECTAGISLQCQHDAAGRVHGTRCNDSFEQCEVEPRAIGARRALRQYQVEGDESWMRLCDSRKHCADFLMPQRNGCRNLVDGFLIDSDYDDVIDSDRREAACGGDLSVENEPVQPRVATRYFGEQRNDEGQAYRERARRPASAPRCASNALGFLHAFPFVCSGKALTLWR